MDFLILNFKRHLSGAMQGGCNLQAGILTILGCKVFKKDERIWLGLPAERVTDKEGKEIWKPTIQITEAGMKHLQNAVRGQLRVLLDNAGGDQRVQSNGDDRRVQDAAAALGGTFAKPKFAGTAFRGEHGDRAYQESRRAAQAADDIPF